MRGRTKNRAVKSKEKITWDMVYEDFMKTYPTLVKSVTRWNSYDVGVIEIYLMDGTRLLYDYDERKATILPYDDRLIF